jgi:hypothetical protein
MIDQDQQDPRKEAQQLIAEAQAARVQAHVRAMLSRLHTRRARFLRAA